MPDVEFSHRTSGIWGAALVTVCLTADFSMAPVLSLLPGTRVVPLIPPLLLAIVGCVLAQGCLLAAWLAWSDQPFAARLTRHWIFAAILYLVWLAGLAVTFPNRLPVGFFVGLAVPLVSLAAQFPLWIARQGLGWRLVRGERSDLSASKPLTIRGLMVATVVVAVTLALARVAPSPDGKPLGLAWLAMAIAASVISTITMLPASTLLFWPAAFGRGTCWAALYASGWVASIWLVVLVVWLWGLSELPPWPIVAGLSVLIPSFAATVVLAAAAARSRGYRLVWGRALRGNSAC